MADPKIVASRGEYRLVHEPRDEKLWPNVSDLTLEHLATDAMGEAFWEQVDRWCLSEVAENQLLQSEPQMTDVVALKMLLDTGPVSKRK